MYLLFRCPLAVAIMCLTCATTLAHNPLLDPVTTFTNGMALPSTDPMRSHNVYWQCDPYRIGCCGGHYNCPVVAFGLFPNSCHANPRRTNSMDCRDRAPSIDGMEEEGMTTLGSIPAGLSISTGGSGPPGIQRAGPGAPSMLQGLIGQ